MSAERSPSPGGPWLTTIPRLPPNGIPPSTEHPAITVRGRRAVHPDIACPEWRVVIEFDGYQFHRRPANVQRDINQTMALDEAGWAVLRVRENLPSIARNDVLVPSYSNEVDTAKGVLRKLAELGFTAHHGDRYLTTGAPWAHAVANTEIHRELARSIETDLPHLAAEWHPRKNGTVLPSQVHPGTQRSWWWLCGICAHEWPATPATRRKHGCKVCGHVRTARARARAEPGESLADLYPDLINEWHPTKNPGRTPGELKPGSNQRAWWLCAACGHEWLTKVSHRTHGSGCSSCARLRTAQARLRPTEPARSLADLPGVLDGALDEVA